MQGKGFYGRRGGVGAGLGFLWAISILTSNDTIPSYRKGTPHV